MIPVQKKKMEDKKITLQIEKSFAGLGEVAFKKKKKLQ